MTKKPVILFVLFFISISLFAFAKSTVPAKKSPAFDRLFIQNFTDTGGRTVSLDSAQLCIDRYAALMADHGFASQAGLPINIRLKKTDLITTGETFDGKNLQDWLNATAASYSASGKTFMIKIQLGVYDDNYLNTYQPNATLRAASKNRIAVFIIPYDASSGQPVRALAAQPAGGTGGGGTGYDLGGVQP
jgi:hypothetical protein